jgi:hypothetical protein
MESIRNLDCKKENEIFEGLVHEHTDILQIQFLRDIQNYGNTVCKMTCFVNSSTFR